MNGRDDFDTPPDNSPRFPVLDDNGRRNGGLGWLYEAAKHAAERERAAREREIQHLEDTWERS